VIRLGVVAALVMFVMLGGGVLVTAQRGVRVITDAQCAAPLGAGVKTKRVFCDVLIATAAGDSISIAIPSHTGSPTLRFDLHNRFTVPAIVVPGALTFARHEAIVSVVRPTPPGDLRRGSDLRRALHPAPAREPARGRGHGGSAAAALPF
jgi:hypothetical protein